MIAGHPLPEITPLTEPFWSAAKARRLVVQRCDECGALRFPPEPGCYECGSLRSSWVPVSGRATLWSWTLCHPPLLPYFQERAPWPVAVVQLEEGPRMVTNLAGVPVEEYEIGMPLIADFEDVDGEITLVVFRRATRFADP
jgi:uncharacterized OB-fold protein